MRGTLIEFSPAKIFFGILVGFLLNLNAEIPVSRLVLNIF